MKILSIRQPWAMLVCLGARTLENRNWNTSYRGEIAIHASVYKGAVEHFMEQDVWDDSIKNIISFGAIIGVTELYDTVPFAQRMWDDPCAEGPFCFLFRKSRLFRTPVPHQGRVKLCDLPSGIAMQVEECKADCIDVETSELRVRCLRAIPLGKVPKSFIRQEPRWWKSSDAGS